MEEIEFKICGRCFQEFESKYQNNFCPSCIMDDQEERANMHESCPACGEDYDEIDYEYQICHICKHKA